MELVALAELVTLAELVETIETHRLKEMPENLGDRVVGWVLVCRT